MIPSIPDGTLVRNQNNDVFLIVDNLRYSVRDFEGGEAETSGYGVILTLNDEELNGIQRGHAVAAELPGLEAALEVSREDEVASNMPRRYMQTTATLSQDAARIDAVTKTWTRQPWVGFTGGVVVLFGNANGEYIGNTEMMRFGVDGFRIPFKTWTRQDWWSQSVPADVAANATAMEIIHTHSPRDRLLDILNQARQATAILVDIANQVRTVFVGEAAAAPRSKVETAAPARSTGGGASKPLFGGVSEALISDVGKTLSDRQRSEMAVRDIAEAARQAVDRETAVIAKAGTGGLPDYSTPSNGDVLKELEQLRAEVANLKAERGKKR